MSVFFWGEAGVKGKSSKVPDMFLREFPIAPHIYLICFGKCCPPFTYIRGPKRRNSTNQNKTFFLCSGMSQSDWVITNPKKKKKKKIAFGKQLV
jgi:hypothetical protein